MDSVAIVRMQNPLLDVSRDFPRRGKKGQAYEK
jgi:hypothetical protein